MNPFEKALQRTRAAAKMVFNMLLRDGTDVRKEAANELMIAILELEDASTEAGQTPNVFIIGGKYNWKGQSDRLVYLGRNWSERNGYWHQFRKIGDPRGLRAIWCEVPDADLHMLEETKAENSPLGMAAQEKEVDTAVNKKRQAVAEVQDWPNDQVRKGIVPLVALDDLPEGTKLYAHEAPSPAEMWERFMNHLNATVPLGKDATHKNFIGSAERYRVIFLAANNPPTS